MKRKIIFGGSLILAALGIITCGVSNFSSVSFSHEKTPVKESVLNNAEPVYEELSSTDLAVSINKSQVTPISQSYNVNFSSKIDAYTDRYQHCYITIINTADGGDIVKNRDYVTGKDEYGQDMLDEDGNLLTEEDMPVHEGAVYTIQNINSKKDKADVVIPSRLRYANAFYIEVTTIFGQVFAEEKQALDVQSITIPATIASIGDDAFAGINPEAVINVQSAADEEGYAENWCPNKEQVNYGYELTDAEQRKLDTAVYGGTFSFGSGKNFMLGYIPTDGSDKYPLVVHYKSSINGGTATEKSLELPVTGKSFYNAVGDSAGAVAFERNVDIPLEAGEVVDDESVYFTNVFEAVSRDIPDPNDPEKIAKKWEPNTEVNYLSRVRLSYILKDSISNYMEYSFRNLSSFAGYTTIYINVHLDSEIYQVLKASAYEQNKRSIDNGDMYIRYRFTAADKYVYCFTYLDSTGATKYIENTVYTPIDQFVLTEEAVATFMFKNTDIAPDFDATKVKGLTIKGLTISYDLFSAKGKAATKSELTTRFGNLEIISANMDNVVIYDVDGIIIWTVVGVTLFYILLTIGYFIYCKNVYKNDEFKRVKPKQFFKKAILAFGGIMITLLSVMFIVLRGTLLNNSVVVFNPIDAFIIIFTVIALIIIGYSIKNLVASIKANNEKRRNEKLKIAEDVDDDGTH